MLKHVLENRGGYKVAVIVNDMASLNIDVKLVEKSDAHLSQVEEKLVSMENGCICCTLREDLLVEIKRLALQNRYDYILIESTGIAEPLPVAETFTFDDGTGAPLSKWARLDTMVTVVDCSTFFEYVDSTAFSVPEESSGASGKAEGDEEEGCGSSRPLSQLLVEQIEFADVVVLSKTDLVTSDTACRVEEAVKRLNPDARIVRVTWGQVELSSVLGTKLFSEEKAAKAPQWLQVPRDGPHVPETELYGIGSWVWRSSRPLHPLRLHNLTGLPVPLPGVIRSKGFVWLASHPQVQGEWSSAGRMYSLDPARVYEEEEKERGSEIVLIGRDMDKEQLTKMLDACVATDDEMNARDWENEDDPYDHFEVQELELEDEEEEGEEDDDDEDEEDEEQEEDQGHSHKHDHHHGHKHGSHRSEQEAETKKHRKK